MFKKILIANRGEIAVRIIRACKEMGITSVAVYTEADSKSLHVALADEKYCIGKAESKTSYLNQELIISVALLSKAEAIHPGYGFLSENADFAKLCQKNNIVFIGPNPESMKLFSNKSKLKEIITKTGIKVIPGTVVIKTIDEAEKAASAIGYPLMLKACEGGGGRGIRLIFNASMLKASFDEATREALQAFANGDLYIEKYISPARHIEFQILADENKNVVCLGERDCSIQRKNQKLIEESPSPAILDTKREEMMELITKAIKEIGYIGAGTLEFLLDSNGCFWFMEMNLRLQVEHGVTEMLTGFDIVKWQIRIASGMKLDFTQKDIKIKGCAIECRINAKSCGTTHLLNVPGGPSVRFDTFIVTGYTMTPYYDSLLGKLIVFAKTREESLRKLRASLCELVIEGVETNRGEQLQIVLDDKFSNGSYDLTFMNNR